METKKMIEELTEIISEIIDFPKEKLNYDSGPELLPEWDSLAHICIVSAIEDKYKIKIKLNMLEEIKSIRDIENIIKENNG